MLADQKSIRLITSNEWLIFVVLMLLFSFLSRFFQKNIGYQNIMNEIRCWSYWNSGCEVKITQNSHFWLSKLSMLNCILATF